MPLSIGIVGLPNVGKSTLFNALTNAGVVAANYPFATIEPNTGVVPIPDPRVSQLARIFGSPKFTHATVTFVDIAGLVKGASEGEGLGNLFLANIRDVNAVCHVVRAFTADNVVHISDDIDPVSDIATVETELAMADLQTIDKRLGKLRKEATVDKKLAGRLELLEQVREVVASGEMISRDSRLMSRREQFADLHLLTAKPVIYVFNCDEVTLADQDRREALAATVAPADALFLDTEIEAELMDLDPVERQEMLESIGQEELGLDAVIRAAYHTLGLQSFLTAGDKEARAWTVSRGATAPEAAGVIHTDFQRGFIAAEVVAFADLNESGSWLQARNEGLIRTEGRSYVMQPDDVVLFRFNV
jgi:GTP-binding protein YchF